MARIGEMVPHTMRQNYEPALPVDPLLFSQSLTLAFPGELKPRTMLRLWVSEDYLAWGSLHEYEMPEEKICPLNSTTVVNLAGLEKS